MAAAIHLITPVVTEGLRNMSHLEQLNTDKFILTNSILDKGPVSIQTPSDDAEAAPGVVKRAIEAEDAGAKACIVDCFGDPGVLDARKKVKIPIYGPGEVTMREASKLGKYSIVTVLESVVGMINANAIYCKVSDNLVSVEVIDIAVLDIETNLEKTMAALGAKSLEAVAKGAKTIVPGCTGFFNLDGKIKQILVDAGHPDVEVLDPIPTTIRVAQAELSDN
ncbi:Asp/Glu racemase [Fomitopsis betulina]|nr:Asp/Glu racemase [Fomitopsis betulina]